MSPLPNHVLIGAAYYYEYGRTGRLEADLDLMVNASLNVIRVGESVWSTWEPEDGVFDLDWLQPVLDGAHTRGISVILGTPTYAVPPWLARRYPDIAGERGTGHRIPWGGRQEVDHTNPTFLFHAERVSRRILDRYARHPAVIGVQVDNEPGMELLHNHGVFQRFADDLRHRYGDVQTLNHEWGLTYWSHRLSTWADLWTPDGNLQPQYDVAWRRFQAQLVTEFIEWQAHIARDYTTDDQFVTTCIAYDRPAVDDVGLTHGLDVAAGNAYYQMQEGLLLPQDPEKSQTWTTTSLWALFQSADRMFASKQSRFLVTETNAMHIGYPWDSRPAYDGQWRQAAWALIARGASMIEYWHWHTLHYGTETYWGGILPHSGHPGRTYREIARLGADLRPLADLLPTMTPEADVALLYSTPSKWLMQKYPALSRPDGTADDRAYQGLVDPFYRGFFDAKSQVRILNDTQLPPPDLAAAAFPVLVAAGIYVAANETLDWLVDYARAGGHLIIGPRTGYGDHEGRAREERAPGHLAAAAGIWYDEFSNITGSLPVTAPGEHVSTLDLTDAAGTRWVDGITVDQADVIAQYEHPHFGQWPAITTRRHGQGRVTYIGTIPNPELAAALARWAVPSPVHGWTQLPSTVTVATSVNDRGERVHVVHNWAWDKCTAVVPQSLTDPRTGEAWHRGDELNLEPWDVRILVQSPTEKN